MPKILFFPYFGPSRRSDLRVVEIRLEFGAEDDQLLVHEIGDIRRVLLEAGVETDADTYAGVVAVKNRFSRFAHLIAQTAVLLQSANGHRVSFFSVIAEPEQGRFTALVEHEHSEVGMAAVKLGVDAATGKFDSFVHDCRLFSRFASDRLLPLDTYVIMKLAQDRGIPVFQLEREPLQGRFNTGVRVRPNGLLMLGHAKHAHVLDGTFCVDKANDELKAMRRNPSQRSALLKKHGIATVLNDHDLEDSAKTFHLLLINQQVFALEQTGGESLLLVENLQESVLEMCRTIYKHSGCAAISVSVRAASLAVALAQSGAKVLDFNLAPDLEELLNRCENGSSLMETAAGALLDWLFPDAEAVRIPSIAITGTNGKTTTSRMTSHILHVAGRKPGLVCTDGIFLDGKLVNAADASSFLGHARVLTSPQVDTAVLESHHRGIAVRGFAFHECDVAICLNVTEEHLEKGEIETLEEMATIKRALLERARHAAVLFADDPHCLAMIRHLNAERICLVSLQCSRAELMTGLTTAVACFCVLETIESESWIALYDKQLRIPVMPVNQIPATFDGAARFNVSNAMHAIAACYFAGTNIDSIRVAMRGFSAGEKYTPGRMNEIEGLPFRVIIDFAHNPDGIKNVCDFADRVQVAGRKLISFAVAVNRSKDSNTKVAKAAAGHFDFYFCKDYQHPTEDPRDYLGPFVQQVLIDEGVPKEQTSVTTYGREAIYGILDACQPGDILMLLLGHIEKLTVPGYIKDYIALRSAAGAD